MRLVSNNESSLGNPRPPRPWLLLLPACVLGALVALLLLVRGCGPGDSDDVLVLPGGRIIFRVGTIPAEPEQKPAVIDPFSVDAIEAEFARLLGRDPKAKS